MPSARDGSPAVTALFGGRKFGGVIFDLDGTLIDSTPAVTRSWTAWAHEFGVPREKLVGNHGVPAAAIVAQSLPADQVPAALARIVEIEVGDVEGIIALPGAARAMRELIGVPHAIATSCTADLAAARLAASGFLAPEVVVTADDVAAGKPAPDPFLLAAERLGVAAADCLVVEDAPKGLIGARAAGCATLAVTTTTPRAELDADEVIDTLADVAWVPAGTLVEVYAAGEPV